MGENPHATGVLELGDCPDAAGSPSPLPWASTRPGEAAEEVDMRDTIVEEGAALRALLERLEREEAERRAAADDAAGAAADYRRHRHAAAAASAVTAPDTERV